jgi:hypothetical protein
MSPRSWLIIFLLSARCCLSAAKSRESSRRGGEPGRKRRSFRFFSSLLFSVEWAERIQFSITSMVYSFRLFRPMSRSAQSFHRFLVFVIGLRCESSEKWRLDWRCGFPFFFIIFLLWNGSGRVLFELPRLAAGSICSKIVFFSRSSFPLYRRKVFASIPAAGI